MSSYQHRKSHFGDTAISRPSYVHNKGKHPESGSGRREITYWHQAEESDANGGVYRRLMPTSDLPARTTRRVGVFLLYRIYLWNKQQVMSINLTTWSTMQYHVVVDHVFFYVIESQVRYNGIFIRIRQEAYSESGPWVQTCLTVNMGPLGPYFWLNGTW